MHRDNLSAIMEMFLINSKHVIAGIGNLFEGGGHKLDLVSGLDEA